MGPSPDSWWVDAAHQLEKQRETEQKRGREVHCVSVITCESCWNSEKTRENSLYFYPSKSMLVDCHNGDTDRTWRQCICIHTLFFPPFFSPRQQGSSLNAVYFLAMNIFFKAQKQFQLLVQTHIEKLKYTRILKISINTQTGWLQERKMKQLRHEGIRTFTQIIII